MPTAKDFFITLVCRLLSFVFSPFITSSPLPSSTSSILIIKPCCIGDVLMATPAIALARAAFPDTRIAVAVGPWAKEALVNNPKVDELIECGSVGSGSSTKLGDYVDLLKRVRQGKFQVSIVLDRSPLVSLIPFLAGIPHRIGIDSGGRGFSLTTKVQPRLEGHEVELYLDVVRTISPSLAGPAPSLEFYPSCEAMAWAEKTIEETAIHLKPRKRVAIHPGGGINPGRSLLGKRWPPEGFAAVAAHLMATGAAIVLIGGAGDEEASVQMKASLKDMGFPLEGPFLDLTGRTTLDQLGAVLKRCQLYLGNDSGPMHLAAAVGTPVVALFGPSKPAVYGPYPSGIVIHKGEHCGRCLFKGGLVAQCRSDFRCIKEISVEEVQERMAFALGGKKGLT